MRIVLGLMAVWLMPIAAGAHTPLAPGATVKSPGEYVLTADSISKGEFNIRIEADNVPVAGTTRRFEAETHTGQHGEGYAITVITQPLGGKHAISVACNENAGDLRVHDFSLSAFQVR